MRYWENWARQRGAHYYAERQPHDSAESSAELVSSDPDLQSAFVVGWREASQSDSTRYSPDVTRERIDGPTPAGGDYSVATYLNDREIEVDKKQATQMVITEYKASGERVAETRSLVRK